MQCIQRENKKHIKAKLNLHQMTEKPRMKHVQRSNWEKKKNREREGEDKR